MSPIKNAIKNGKVNSKLAKPVNKPSDKKTVAKPEKPATKSAKPSDKKPAGKPTAKDSAKPKSNIPANAVILESASGYTLAVFEGEYEGTANVRIAKVFTTKDDVQIIGKAGITIPLKELKSLRKKLIEALNAI